MGERHTAALAITEVSIPAATVPKSIERVLAVFENPSAVAFTALVGYVPLGIAGVEIATLAGGGSGDGDQRKR